MHLYKTPFGIITRIFFDLLDFLMDNSLIKKVLFLKTLWNFWKGGPQSTKNSIKGNQLFFDIDILTFVLQHFVKEKTNQKKTTKKNLLVFLHKNQNQDYRKNRKNVVGYFCRSNWPICQEVTKKETEKKSRVVEISHWWWCWTNCSSIAKR